ncbi:carbon-nitrogen family hydrolase [Terrilactibacillus sp. BCM23-1]|uniref:Carbon-nitrogen family hydrolase n=1 Tax=Terrilactibacillus tamarindi TaxID=2599694 RepID=A0A6N8CPN6_9BACI|nr:carbon-nitrogen family hydrolase [Terrilactibacillus tamarindi]MTT32134.1 carbon-nitrogen family hydrolase [Terrilactibacillus tamarindi]
MKCALIQYDIVFGDPKANFKKVHSLIDKAMADKPDVIILPELWTTAYDLERLDEIADPDAKETCDFISSLAKKYDVNIIAGSIAKKNADNVTNTQLIFNRQGDLVSDYDKVHLFRLMNEEKFLAAGRKEGHFNLDGTPCAGFICYDIRFTEWLRKHVVSGAKVLFVSAEWPNPRLDHWRTLLICRAIENQAYVVACNRTGKDPNNTFFGHSLIINPWGEIIAEGGEDEAIVTGDIDLDELDQIRTRIPVFEDRRPELY